MSADIEKEVVLDGRVVQNRPRFAISKGALSVSNAPFNAIASTSSQATWNIYAPSENVFIDRHLQLTGQLNLSVQVVMPPCAAGTPIMVPGVDCALCPFPINSACSTMSSTINDTTSVINSQDVMKEVLRLCDYRKNRLQRTCPTMLDKYQNYDDCFGALNNTLGAYDASTSSSEVPNGAYPGLQFTSANGQTVFSPNGSGSVTAGGQTYNIVNGMPVTAASSAVQVSYTICFRVTSTEPLVLSPFVFSDIHEWDTGLFGINNIQVVMNLQSNLSRLIRSTTRTGKTFSNCGFNQSAPNPWALARINVQFLTPNLSVDLPPKSVIPYMEFPRYISNPGSGGIAPGATQQLSSQTITLPTIPELLIIFVKAVACGDVTAPGGNIPVPVFTSGGGPLASSFGDFYLPLASSMSGATFNPVSFNWDNFSGLLSSHTTEELYSMCVKNGLEMDWAEWSGLAHTAGTNYALSPVPTASGIPTVRQQGQLVPTVGSILVLKPGQDLVLQSGQAPSLVGNFTLQFNLSVYNNSAYTLVPTIYTITANSGFFESIRGSSRIIKGVLSEQDILSAPMAPEGTKTVLERSVGGLSFGSLGNILSRAKRVYDASKPAISAVRQAVDSAPAIMNAVKGQGTGAGGRKSLASRLM